MFPSRIVECDEIWGFVQKKEGHKAPEEAHDDSIGDAYCFVAIERSTKQVLNFALGRRSKATTNIVKTPLAEPPANIEEKPRDGDAAEMYPFESIG
jgi:IS1 family transposase